MAQYFTDFRELTLGAAPSDITVEYASAAVTLEAVAGNVLAGSDRKVNIDSVLTANFERLGLAYQKGAIAVDGATTVRLLAEYNNLNFVGALVAGAGNTAARTGYAQALRNNNHRIFKYNAGAETTLGTSAAPTTDPLILNLEIQLNPATGSVESRHWTQAESRPETAQISATDATLTTGWCGISMLTGTDPSGSSVWIHSIGVGTQGDPAPTDVVPTGPSITASDPVVDDAEATITASGLSGAITATLGGYSLTTAGTLPNLTYTLDIASITANGPVSAPRIGESLTLSVTGDEGTATSAVATQAASGMAAITLAGTLANETDSLIDGMQSASGLTVAVPDVMYYPTIDNTSIAATGALTTDSESFTLILIQGGSATVAGNAYAFTVTPESVTPVDPPGISVSQSVRRSITSSLSSSIQIFGL